MKNFKKILIKKIEKEMVKVPPNKEYNSTGDSCFNLGCLKAIEIIKKEKFRYDTLSPTKVGSV